MLTIEIPGKRGWDDDTETFYTYAPVALQMEHSLAAISKWEKIWHKPFLGREHKTTDEVVSYIQCMCVKPEMPDVALLSRLTEEDFTSIEKYIDDPMTATWFTEDAGAKGHGSFEVVTAEIIYYWMIELGIPVSYDMWHLNALLTLIKVINLKRAPKKKMSFNEIAERNNRLNEERLKKFNTKG